MFIASKMALPKDWFAKWVSFMDREFEENKDMVQFAYTIAEIR